MSPPELLQPEAAGWWEDRHRRLGGLEAVGYDGLGHAFNRWMYRVRAHVFAACLRPYLSAPSQATVLDVGSGSGFYIDRWRELGVRDITVCDRAQAAVERLRRRFPGVPALELDIAGEIPHGLGPFDAVSALDVLFHLLDDESHRRAVANLAGLVSPEGLLVLSENLLRAGRARRYGMQVDRPERLLLDQLDASGFDLVLRRPMFVLMNEPNHPQGSLHRAWWRALSRAIIRRPRLGAVLGAALYPAERVLLKRLRRAPSTELLVWRRRARTDALS